MSKQTMPPVTRQKKKILGFFPRRQTIVFLVVFTLIGSSAILYQILSTRGANYSWLQTSWSGGADTGATASHDSDQTDWDKYYSKDDNVSTSGGQLTLNSTTLSMTDTDFSDSATNNTYIDNGTVKLKKPNGAACSSSDECTCGYCDITCREPQVGDSYGGGIIFQLSGDEGLISKTSDNGYLNWSGSISSCDNDTANGYDDWYLPTLTELSTLYTLRATVGGFCAGENTCVYWSSTANWGSSNAYYYAFDTNSTGELAKTRTFYSRCIRSFSY